MGIEELIKELTKLKGISNIRELSEKEKEEILKLEKDKNAISALKSRHTLVFSKGDLKGLKLEKSSVEISKIKLEEAISVLPSLEAHKKIAEEMELKENELTVLVGLDEIEKAVEEVKQEAVLFEEIDLRAVYSMPIPELKINYAELFSYLNTRPTEVSYSYEFMQEREQEADISNYEVLEKINKKRKMEKTIYFGERSDYIPEGISVKQMEQFNVFRKTSYGFALNMVLYDLGFS